jgi:hypothetical protein
MRQFPKRVYEAFEYINKNPDEYKDVYANKAVEIVFRHAVEAGKKFILPADDPVEYKFDTGAYAMTAINLNTEARRLYVFCRADLNKMQRESMFMSMLAGLTKQECELLFAVKNQNLLGLFPNLPISKMCEMWMIAQPEVKPDTLSITESITESLPTAQAEVLNDTVIVDAPAVKKPAKKRGLISKLTGGK